MTSTFEEHAKQFQREWKAPMPNEIPTTHQQTVERFTERFNTDPHIQELASVLTSTTDRKRDEVKKALAGDTK